MSEILITSRMKKILEIVSETTEAITIKDISKKLGVSSRTVLREMPEVEKWLKHHNFTLIKKPRVGIKLEETLDDRKRLLHLLEGESIERIFDSEERQTVIISELLQRKEPTKLFYFSSMLNVSEGTISHDLDKVEKWLTNYELTLVRKPGLGVYLKGNEKSFRKAMINMLHENLDQKQILDMIRENLITANKPQDSIEISTRNRLMNLIDKELIKKIEAIVHSAENDLEYRLADSSYTGLIVHLTLAIQRIKNNEKIIMKEEFLQDLIKSKEYKIAEKIGNKISEFLNIEIPRDEIGYITMHLKGAKMRNGVYNNELKSMDEFIVSNFELTKLVNDMIKIAEKESGYSLKENENLLIGLVSHLRPAITRMKMNLDIRNPLLSNIKKLYPEIFEISKKCAQIFNDKFGVSMPETEIGFIAMHIGAAIEKIKRGNEAKKIYRVVVTCTSGIGTSKLLASRLKQEFGNIYIVDITSTIDINKKWILNNNINLIISTIQIKESPVPTVVVNPLLLEEDLKMIHSALEKIDINIERDVISYAENNLNLKERAVALKDYGEGIIEILDSFFFEEGLKIDSIAELIKYISNNVDDDEKIRAIIERDLIAREEQGSTILKDKGIILLHCRTEGVMSLKFGVMKLEKNTPLLLLDKDGIEEKISTILVMLTPLGKNNRHLEVISEISRNLIDDPNFIGTLTSGTREEIFNKVNTILNNFLYSRIYGI